MAWNLGSNIQDEIDRSLESTRLTPAQIAELYPPYPYSQHLPIVNQGAVVDGVYEQDATHGGSRNPPRPAFPARAFAPALRVCQRSLGSALDALLGRRSTASARTPGRSPASTPRAASRSWRTTRTSTRRCRASGTRWGCTARPSVRTARSTSRASPSPGLPGVVIGHNESIAWGFTNLYPDTEDLYLEKIQGDRLPVQRAVGAAPARGTRRFASAAESP